MTERLSFDVDADLFMAVRQAVGTEESRIYLTGVFIEPIPEGGAWLVATDGTIMLVAKDLTAVAPQPAIVQLRQIEDAPDDDGCDCFGECATAPRDFSQHRIKFDLPQECCSAAVLLNSVTNWVEPFGLIEVPWRSEDFPKWRQVWRFVPLLPSSKEPRLPGYNAWGFRGRLLSRLAGDGDFRIVTESEAGPSAILFHDRPNLVGMIMPCRIKLVCEALVTELRSTGDAEFAAAKR